MSEGRVKFFITFCRDDITIKFDWDEASYNKLIQAFVAYEFRAIELNNMAINFDQILYISREEDEL